MCEHNTSMVIYSGKETSVEICEWGCDRILIHKLQPSGVTVLVREVEHPALAALRARVEALETDKERTREAVRMARQKLQATQINWQEDCLFQCNDLLGIALDVCPSCTWRGDVTLVNGECPYCKTNWHELRKA